MIPLRIVISLLCKWGLIAKVNFDDLKNANETIHKIIENYIDNNYINSDKVKLKHELELIKEALSQDIESFYQKGETE